MINDEFTRALFGQIFGTSMPAGINMQQARPAPKQINAGERARLEVADAARRQRLANRDVKFPHAR